MSNTNTVPSAEEILFSYGVAHKKELLADDYFEQIKKAMREFNRLHLEAMRDEICKEVKVKPPTLESIVWCEVDKQSIIETANTYIKNNKL